MTTKITEKTNMSKYNEDYQVGKAYKNELVCTH